MISENGMSEDGPDLKTAISSHAITIINSTMSIITGGNTSIPDITSETWYYNHETKTFTSGPKLMKARRSHGSATIIDKTTKEKIPVVTGGHFGNKLFQVTDLTELLIKGQWQRGTYY
jgi:hypothetical protein